VARQTRPGNTNTTIQGRPVWDPGGRASHGPAPARATRPGRPPAGLAGEQGPPQTLLRRSTAAAPGMGLQQPAPEPGSGRSLIIGELSGRRKKAKQGALSTRGEEARTGRHQNKLRGQGEDGHSTVTLYASYARADRHQTAMGRDVIAQQSSNHRQAEGEQAARQPQAPQQDIEQLWVRSGPAPPESAGHRGPWPPGIGEHLVERCRALASTPPAPGEIEQGDRSVFHFAAGVHPPHGM